MNNLSKQDCPVAGGVYGIKNNKTGYMYIGSTSNFYTRLLNHRSSLNRNIHENPKLQLAFNEGCWDDFEFIFLEECDNFTDREEYHIKQYDKVYNRYSIGKSCLKKIKPIIPNKPKSKTPSNFKEMQKKRWRKVAKLINNQIVKIYDNCADAARSINMEPKSFHQYINTNRKSKYFTDDVKFKYYDICI